MSTLPFPHHASPARFTLRHLVSLAVCLLLLLTSAAWTTASTPKTQKRQAQTTRRQISRRPARTFKTRKARTEAALETEHREGAAGDEDDPDGRDNWFIFQRTYPYDSLPQEARRRAWANRPLRDKRGNETEAQIWQPIGPSPAAPQASLFPNFGYNSGRINAIAISPVNPGLVLIGGATGGIWRSTDGGANFVAVTDNQVDLAVGSIAFSASNPSIVYAGMGDAQGGYIGSGVLKSVDSGQTWTKVSNLTLPSPGQIFKIDVDPNDSNRVYVAQSSWRSTVSNTTFSSGFYFSTDGGVSWTRTFTGLPRDFVISPDNAQTLYLTMRRVDPPSIGSPGLFKSINGGLTWTSIYTPSPTPVEIRVGVSPANPQKIYVYHGNGSASNSEIHLAVSSNGGADGFPTDYVLTTVDKGQLGYNTYLVIDPANANTIYIGTRDVYRSTNGGSTWTNLTKTFDETNNYVYRPDRGKAHPDQHCLAIAPGNLIYLGNDGGLYLSQDNAATFQSLNSTLSLTQFVGLARHPTDASITYGGTQDNGTQRRLGANLNGWQDFAGGDGGRVLVLPQDPSIVLPSYVRGVIWKFTNNGNSARVTLANGTSTFRDAETNTSDRIAFYPPIVGNGADSTIYTGTHRLWVSPNALTATTISAAGWTAPGGAADLTKGGGDTLSAIGVTRANTSVIYTGSAQGQAMMSSNGGQSWSEVMVGLPNRSITNIKVDQTNPAVAFLSVSGFGTGHVFKTVNGTAGAATVWTDISGNLPNIPVNALLVDPLNPNTLYAGTDIGVFRSSVNGLVWEAYNDGMPPVIVMDFSANASGAIQVATYGRGAYEMTAAGQIPSYSISGRVVDGDNEGIAGATVTLSGAKSNATTTDASGNYSFTGLETGNYVLTPSKTGQFISYSRNVDSLTASASSVDLRLDPYILINAHVSDALGNNVNTVAIKINNQSLGAPLTNSLGNASLTITPTNTNPVTLTPEKSGYVFSPQSLVFNKQSGNQTVNFAAAINGVNSIDQTTEFITWHYRDFLNREPDSGGLGYWSFQIDKCNGDALCIHKRRIAVSAAFFIELEFQQTGSFVYRFYSATLNRRPTYPEFTADRNLITPGPQLEQSKQQFADQWVQRAEFVQKYQAATTAETFVDALIQTVQQVSGVDLSTQRAFLVSKYQEGTSLNQSRSLTIQAAIEDTGFKNAVYNPSFVLMQYFGYLHRDPDEGGYLFWLNILNNKEPGNYKGMVCSFLTSAEYQKRFGTVVTRFNRDCNKLP
ncbi:MAG TPA: carboxypeptidase regulatory-like domain-containing protein [Pyrinomonadaceae bacterium]|jgi:hypothetical protein